MIEFRNFGTPLITFERIEPSTSDLVQTYRTDPYCVRTTKRPLSGHGLGHVTKLRNFGTRLITFERIDIDDGTIRDIRFKFGIEISGLNLA